MSDDNDLHEEQHMLGHELAKELQTTIERFQAEHDVLPGTIFLGIAITYAGWQDFCRSLGMSPAGVIEIVAMTQACSADLREYLHLFAPRFTEYMRRLEEESVSDYDIQ